MLYSMKVQIWAAWVTLLSQGHTYAFYFLNFFRNWSELFALPAQVNTCYDFLVKFAISLQNLALLILDISLKVRHCEVCSGTLVDINKIENCDAYNDPNML
jgi:hypothetical protein